MGYTNGRFAKVVYGTYTVAGMGNWSLDGWSNDVVETTSFGDVQKTFEFTMQSYGTLKCSGMYVTGDTTGQDLLMSAFQNQSKITTGLKLYIDNTSYYTVDVTTVTSSAFLMTSVSPITFDKAQVGQISFSAQISGKMTLV